MNGGDAERRAQFAGQERLAAAVATDDRYPVHGVLAAARAALPAVRRVLANMPTYMIFDDHDDTDDWNLTS